MAKEYVGIDLHRRRSVIYRMDQAGDKIDSVRVDNEPSHFAKEVSAAPVGSDVIVEATYGWYWAADLLKEMGYRVHLANPHGNDWGHRRVKNDERDARDLADLLAPRTPGRGLDRPAQDPRAPRDDPLPDQAVPTCAPGSRPRSTRSWPRTGSSRAEATCGARAAAPSSTRSSSPTPTSTASPCCGTSSSSIDREIVFLDRDIHRILSDDAGYNAVQAIYGVGPRLRRRLRGRDRRRHPLRLTQGPVLVGRAHPQAPRVRHPRPPGQDHQAGIPPGALGRHRGGGPLPRRSAVPGQVRSRSPSAAASTKANVAIARRVLTLVYYGLRDGEIRCLADQEAA